MYVGISDALRANSNRKNTPIHDSDNIRTADGRHLFPIGAVEAIPGHLAQPRTPRCRPAER